MDAIFPKKQVKLASLILMLILLPGCGGISTVESKQKNLAFNSFYLQMREAIVSSDINTVRSLTLFPFVVKGLLHDDPEQKWDRDTFTKRFHELLAMDSGRFAQEETMLDLFKKHEHASWVEAEDSVFLGAFVFETVEGEWRFVRAYLSE